ncbi:uncharacterized protein LOC142750285 [Rhinoderma darwinii]|uniref:uncharacterized protein LOC142750285 n=1 Tax=Rhinoderma darwinii TaxID=43563 RepID=UPI003F661608
MIRSRLRYVKTTKQQKKTEQWWTLRRTSPVRGKKIGATFIMNIILHYGLFTLVSISRVFSKPSCSSENNVSKNKEETSCINLGLTILPLTEIPKNTAILIMSSNKLKSISTSSFKGLKDLTELDVSDNELTSFEIDLPLMLEELNIANNTLKTLPKVSQLSSLTTLHIYNNLITAIPKTAFKGLKKLATLQLQHNSIVSLDEEVFNDLQSLKHLDLSYNQMWFVPDRLISGVMNLEILYLSGNRLTEIPDYFFGDLELNYVYLERNPWNCNCALVYFKNWLNEDEDRVYEISKEGPTKNQKSVVCSDGTPLIDYDMDHCLIRGAVNIKGDVDINSIPSTTKWGQTELMTTRSWTTTLFATTTTYPTTLTMTTTEVRTTTEKPSTTVLLVVDTDIASTTSGRSSTLTREASTMSEVTRTTEALKTSQRTMLGLITTAYPTTLRMTTTQVRTTTEEPSTTALLVASTDIASTTSEVRVETSMRSPSDKPTEIPVNTIVPARSSRAAAVGMDWVAKVILEHCCLLHLIIYGLCILLMLVGMIITTMCLLWIYCCNQDLIEWLPGIRLIRYSMRMPMSDEDVLLVNNGALESQFRDQSMAGVTKMLVLNSHTRHQEIRYTSGIL